MHPAARIFTEVAAHYEAGRPGYPDELLDSLSQHAGLSRTSRVLDVAAGTGKLTRLLVRSGAEVIALEPLSGMLSELRTVLPDRAAVAGTAEAIPLADAAFDLVTVAQAFHWFDRDRAIPELRRVLKTGGSLALVWNTRDASIDWVAALSKIVDPLQATVPAYDGADAGFNAAGFGPPVRQLFRHSQEMDRGTLLARFASTSYIASLAQEERDGVLAEISEVVDNHRATREGRFSMPYLTEVFLREAV